jgi:outer membrane protein assembly factor BamD (BamD/ComL family)
MSKRQSTVLLFLLSVLSSFLFGCNFQEREAKSHFEKGASALSKQDYYEAKKEFEIVVSQYPNSTLLVSAKQHLEKVNSIISEKEEEAAKVLYDNGVAAMSQGNFHTAKNEFEIILNYYPQSSYAVRIQKTLEEINAASNAIEAINRQEQDKYRPRAAQEANAEWLAFRNNEAQKIKESTVTLEKVEAFPQSYSGNTVIFDKVRLSGDLIRSSDGGFFYLQVCSEDGKCIYSSYSPNGFAIITTPNIAIQLLNIVRPTSQYLARLSCRVKSINTSHAGTKLPPFWGAEVFQIDLYSYGGSIVETLK